MKRGILILTIIFVAFSLRLTKDYQVNHDSGEEVKPSATSAQEDKAIKSLTEYLKSNPQLVKDLAENKQPSGQAKKKLIDWMIGNDQFRTFFLNQLKDEQGQFKWIAKLSDDSKKKLMRIALENSVDLIHPYNDMTQAQQLELVKKIVADDDIGKVMADNFQALNQMEQKELDELKKDNPQFKDYVLQKFTSQQRLKLLRWVMAHPKND